MLNELHWEALDRASFDWQRPRQISDRPEVVRDLLARGYLDVMPVAITAGSQKGGRYCLYRKANKEEL